MFNIIEKGIIDSNRNNNSYTPDELVTFSLSETSSERNLAARNPKTPYYALESLLKRETKRFNMKTLLENPSIPAEHLDKYAYHEDWMLREAVARNENTPRPTLISLLSDNQPIVVMRALAHKKMLLKFLHEFVEKDFYAAAIAENPNIDEAIVNKLIEKAITGENSSYKSTCFQLCHNTNVPLYLIFPLLFPPGESKLIGEKYHFDIFSTDLPLLWKFKHFFMRRGESAEYDLQVEKQTSGLLDCKVFLRDYFDFTEDVPVGVAEEILEQLIMNLPDDVFMVQERDNPKPFVASYHIIE